MSNKIMHLTVMEPFYNEGIYLHVVVLKKEKKLIKPKSGK